MTAADSRIATRRAPLLVTAFVMLAAGCIVDTPAIENTQTGSSAAATTVVAAAPTTPAEPQFEPTEVPAPPTPAVPPTATPVPTATPEPTPAVTPLPTAAPEANFVPTIVEAGLVAVPVSGVSFVLDSPRPILQLGGHTLMYVDDDLLAEVDIFTPIADRDAGILGSYADLIDYLETDFAFDQLEELDSVTIAGFPARVFEGMPNAEPEDPVRAFITDPTKLDDLELGWYPPVRLRLWAIDSPSGPIIVSAESLEDPGQFPDAVRLATEVLSTITFS